MHGKEGDRVFAETPIQKLTDYKENNIYVKREDLLPFSFGGNKVRIGLEYISDLKQKKYDCLIGYGNTKSNLCRVISNLCKQFNLPCYIISPSNDDGSRDETYNSLITQACGAKIIPCNKENVSETVYAVIENCKRNGLNPYYINGDIYGKGNEAVPVEAYVKVYKEILNQSLNMMVNFDYIFVATGTGMTQSGLIAGKQLYGGNSEIIGISVARPAEKENKVISQFLNAFYENNEIFKKQNDIITILDEYICGGYGKYNDKIVQAIKNVMTKEGIPLDLTYTGKAFYGMMEHVKKNRIENKNILFIHTGGTPLFFDHAEEIMC